MIARRDVAQGSTGRKGLGTYLQRGPNNKAPGWFWGAATAFLALISVRRNELSRVVETAALAKAGAESPGAEEAGSPHSRAVSSDLRERAERRWERTRLSACFELRGLEITHRGAPETFTGKAGGCEV